LWRILFTTVKKTFLLTINFIVFPDPVFSNVKCQCNKSQPKQEHEVKKPLQQKCTVRWM
jgi:hypothetical protein